MRDPDAFLRVALRIRRSWEEGLFATDKARWQDVTADERTRWLAECASHHGASYREFLTVAKVVLRARQWEPNQEWRLFRQFLEGQTRIDAEATVNDNLKTLYQVWHKEPQGYVHAFTVHSNDLGGALVGPVLHPRPDAVSEHIPHARATTFGDVIVTPNRDAYEVASTKQGITFDLIDFPTVKLAAEQRADFRMGQEEAARGEFAASARILAEIMGREPSAPSRESEREPEMER